MREPVRLSVPENRHGESIAEIEETYYKAVINYFDGLVEELI
jgi:hypothetical protein